MPLDVTDAADYYGWLAEAEAAAAVGDIREASIALGDLRQKYSLE